MSGGLVTLHVKRARGVENLELKLVHSDRVGVDLIFCHVAVVFLAGLKRDFIRVIHRGDQIGYVLARQTQRMNVVIHRVGKCDSRRARILGFDRAWHGHCPENQR